MKKRSFEPELLDLGPSHYTQREYEDCLRQLGRIGKMLGGDRAALSIFSTLPAPSSILDVGCGGGQFAITLAKRYPHAQLTGIDISPQAIAFAQNCLKEAQVTNAAFHVLPTPELTYPENSFDSVTATLVCHHLNDEQLIHFLKMAYKTAKNCVVLNDLHRHWIAYAGYFVISRLLFNNRLITHDGLISIKRSFKKREWISFLQAADIPLEQCSITWHWPFRWIVCIKK